MQNVQRTTQSWSIIIFSYNEAGTLRSVIDAVEHFLEQIQCSRCEVVIVDDGSSDHSAEIVRRAAEDYANIKPVFHSRNQGIGWALRSGYSAVQCDNVCAVPGDGQFDIAELLPFANVPDKTFVSFFRKENTIYSLSRNILSYINRKLNEVLLGLRQKDVNWVKIYKKAELHKLDLKMNSSLIESEICAKLILHKNRMVETESVYLPRKAGQSKGASLPNVLRAALETLKLVFVVGAYRLKRAGKKISAPRAESLP